MKNPQHNVCKWPHYSKQHLNVQNILFFLGKTAKKSSESWHSSSWNQPMNISFDKSRQQSQKCYSWRPSLFAPAVPAGTPPTHQLQECGQRSRNWRAATTNWLLFDRKSFILTSESFGNSGWGNHSFSLLLHLISCWQELMTDSGSQRVDAFNVATQMERQSGNLQFF